MDVNELCGNELFFKLIFLYTEVPHLKVHCKKNKQTDEKKVSGKILQLKHGFRVNAFAFASRL